MPIYVYKCSKCNKGSEVLHEMKFVGNEQELSKEILKKIVCSKHGLMRRVPQLPQLMGSSEGEFKTERQLLKEKQTNLKKRSRLHFKNDVLKNLDGPEKKYFEKKYKNLKGDHEKKKKKY